MFSADKSTYNFSKENKCSFYLDIVRFFLTLIFDVNSYQLYELHRFFAVKSANFLYY